MIDNRTTIETLLDAAAGISAADLKATAALAVILLTALAAFIWCPV